MDSEIINAYKEIIEAQNSVIASLSEVVKALEHSLIEEHLK